MSEEAVQVGTLRRRDDDSFEGVLTRVFAGHDRAAVWRALTDPAVFVQWLAPGSMELRAGGRVQIDFKDSGIVVDSTLTEFEPERLLTWSWSGAGDPERPLRWALEDAAGGTRLTLTVGLPAGSDAAKACAGFEGHLEMLATALEGVPVKFPLDLYLAARKAYGAQLENA